MSHVGQMIASRAAMGGLLPDLSSIELKTIWTAIGIAWNNVLSSIGRVPGARSEVELNHLLKDSLNSLLAEPSKACPGFSIRYYDWVVSDETWETFDGNQLEKQPDLLIRPRPLSALTADSRRGLFIECKLIGGTNHHTINEYCKSGLLRFVRGEYAWLMPRALMVAYLREELSIEVDLSNFLKKKRLAGNDDYQTTALISGGAGGPACSKHSRTFHFVDQNVGPGPIDVHHIWCRLK